MAVLIEAICIVIRNATIRARFSGGMEQYERECPNSTFCSDGTICRIAFQSWDDTEACLAYLGELGFATPTPEGSPEAAVIIQDTGFEYPCDWLQFACQEGVSAAWLRGTEFTEPVTDPGGAHKPMTGHTTAELRKNYKLISVEDGVEAYGHRQTGKMIYVGRPAIPRRRKWWQIWK